MVGCLRISPFHETRWRDLSFRDLHLEESRMYVFCRTDCLQPLVGTGVIEHDIASISTGVLYVYASDGVDPGPK